MIIGESPGAEEDVEGIPFTGRAGRELGKELKLAGLSTAAVNMGNRLMCHPDANRDPTQEEMDNCEPWITQNVREVNPKVIVLFGRYAISWLSGTSGRVKDTEGLMYLDMCDGCGGKGGEHKDRYANNGKWQRQGKRCKGTMVRRLIAFVYHPASVLRGTPENREKIVHQLRRVVAELKLTLGE